jgi:pimeloyl-ACP methyl ester carboxylesterase
MTFRYSTGVTINYRVVGKGPTPVVFLHGFAAALTTWDDIVPFFPADRFTLYLLDLKGFGFSSKPRDGRYRPEDQAEVVAAFLEAEKLEEVVLVGHSLGGAIALLVLLGAMTAGRPGRIGRLVLIDPAAFPQPLLPVMSRLRRPLLGAAILHLLPVSLMVRFTLARVFHDPSAVTPERVRRYATCFGSRGMAYVLQESCRALVPRRYAELPSLYPTIEIPVLIVWGEQDRIINPRCGERLVAQIPGARLVVIPGCGHNPHEERPRETFGALAGFLGIPD